MPYCSECGVEVKAGDKHCSSCGASLKPIETVKSVKIVEKKSSHTGAIIGVILLISIVGLFFYFSGRHSTGSFTDVAKIVRSPRLSLSNVDADIGWSLSQGCYGTIRGGVNNQGNADANNAYVECNLYKKSGGLLATSSSQVGTVYAGNNKAFQMNIDFSCLSALTEKDVRSDCRVDCSNC